MFLLTLFTVLITAFFVYRLYWLREFQAFRLLLIVVMFFVVGSAYFTGTVSIILEGGFVLLLVFWFWLGTFHDKRH